MCGPEDNYLQPRRGSCYSLQLSPAPPAPRKALADQLEDAAAHGDSPSRDGRSAPCTRRPRRPPSGGLTRHVNRRAFRRAFGGGRILDFRQFWKKNGGAVGRVCHDAMAIRGIRKKNGGRNYFGTDDPRPFRHTEIRTFTTVSYLQTCASAVQTHDAVPARARSGDGRLPS